jgi:hypothetical protein
MPCCSKFGSWTLFGGNCPHKLFKTKKMMSVMSGIAVALQVAMRRDHEKQS